MIDYRERRLRFWCQKVLPLVYDESLSYYELLCKIMKHLSEAETDVSALEQWLEELDAAAVKKVYSEYPLRAEKNGNTVTLKLRSHNVVTSVSAAEDSPIVVTGSGAESTGHLDPDDDTSPMGTTSIVHNAILDIDNATSSKRGAMSASDKQKVDRLYNTFVEAGDNIVVSSTTASNGDTNYTVGVDPAFKVQIQDDELMGDMWEWNSMLSGRSQGCYVVPEANLWSLQSAGQENVSYLPKYRNILNGVLHKSEIASTSQLTGFSIGAQSGNPFSRVTVESTVTEGGKFFTTRDEIVVKGKFYGTGVTNQTARVYLHYKELGDGVYNNQYATHGDQFYPASSVAAKLPYYEFTTGSDGTFEFTIPAGLEAYAYNTGSGLPTTAPGVMVLVFTIYGTYSDVSSNVSVSDMKVSIKSNLMD